MEIGNKIQELRKLKGLSQEEAANALYVSRQSVSLWENNQTQPTLDNLEAMSNLYEVTISVLTGQMLFPEDLINNQSIETKDENLETATSTFILNEAKRAKIPTIIGFIMGMAAIVLFAVPFFGIIFTILGFIVSFIARRIYQNKLNLIGIIFSSVYFFASIFATFGGNTFGF